MSHRGQGIYSQNSRRSRVFTDYGLASTPSLRGAEYIDKMGTWIHLADYDIIDNVVFAVARVDDTEAYEIYQILGN